MTQDLSGDYSSFQQFLAASDINVAGMSPEQSVVLFRNYQQEVARLRERLNASRL